MMRLKLAGAAVVAILTAVPIAAQMQGPIIEKVIVKVNGEIFKQSELEFRQIQELRQQNPELADPTRADTGQLRQALARVTPGLLVDAVDELLLLQHGRELGFTLTDAQFRESIEALKTENNLTDEQLTQALAQEDLTMADYRLLLERQAIIGQVTSREIMSQMRVTDAELRQYYNAHPEEFSTPATVTLREIFVAVPTQTNPSGEPVVNVAQDDAARARVVAARDRLVAGDDPVAVVTEVSESGSKATGGLIGPVDLQQLDPAVGEPLAALAVGEVSQPIRTARGYTVFVIVSRTEPALHPFDDVRADIRRQVQFSRVDTERDRFLTRIRDIALIEWKDDTYRRMYEEELARRVAQVQTETTAAGGTP